jgi:hypothetical protein
MLQYLSYLVVKMVLKDDRVCLEYSPLEVLPTLESVKGVEWAVQIDICELPFVANVTTIKSS